MHADPDLPDSSSKASRVLVSASVFLGQYVRVSRASVCDLRCRTGHSPLRLPSGGNIQGNLVIQLATRNRDIKSFLKEFLKN